MRNEPPAWVKAEPVKLRKNDPLHAAVDRILESCYRQWRNNEAAALDGTDPEGVHQLRVGIRRFRSALSVFSNVIPQSDLAWIRPAARELQQHLNAPRDWDVFIGEIVAEQVEAGGHDRFAAVEAFAGHRRDAAYSAMRSALRDPAYHGFAEDLGTWIAHARWRRPGDDESRQILLSAPALTFATEVIRERHDRAVERVLDLSEQPPEQRHKLRIALKKLRYAVEFFGTLFPTKALNPYVKSLRRLQDDMGRANDIAVMTRLIRELRDDAAQASIDPDERANLECGCGYLLGWHNRDLMDLEKRLLADWQRFSKRNSL